MLVENHWTQIGNLLMYGRRGSLNVFPIIFHETVNSFQLVVNYPLLARIHFRGIETAVQGLVVQEEALIGILNKLVKG